MSLPQVAVKVDALGDFHRFGPHKLQQGNGEAGVPGADPGLGFGQVRPSALQVGGRGAVKAHAGQFVVQRGVVFRFELVALSFSHQALGDQLLGVGIWGALTGSVSTQPDVPRQPEDILETFQKGEGPDRMILYMEGLVNEGSSSSL